MNIRILFHIILPLIGIVFLIPVLSGKERLSLIVLSDVHGYLNTGVVRPKKKEAGLAYLVDKLEAYSSEDDRILIINAGDDLSGSPLSLIHIVYDSPIEKNPIFYLWDKINPDFSVPGNHDLEFYTYHRDYILKNNHRYSSANIVDPSGKLLLPSHKTIMIKDQRVLLVGITTTGVKFWNDPREQKAAKVTDPEAALKELFTDIKPKDEDFVIGVFHSGLNPYRDIEESIRNKVYPANFVKKIARKFSEFDLILSGHDHRLSEEGIPNQYIAGTPVIQTGAHAKTALKVDLLTDKGKLNSVNITHIRGEKTSDPNYLAMEKEFSGIMDEKTGWKYKANSNKTDTAKCLNTILALAARTEEAPNTILPKLRLTPLLLRKGKQISRRHLVSWLSYPNRRVTALIRPEDLEFLKKIQSYDETSYNSRFNIYFTNRIDSDDFEQTLPVVITNYHANGGGGTGTTVGWKIIGRDEDFMMPLMFEFLQNNTPGSIPELLGRAGFRIFPGSESETLSENLSKSSYLQGNICYMFSS